MDLITVIGLVAGILTTGSFIPQIVKIMSHKSAEDVSLLMFLIIGCGQILWLVYGIYINSLPVLLANAVSVLLISFVITLKLRYDGH